jgi:uncharacterized membrane protein
MGTAPSRHSKRRTDDSQEANMTPEIKLLLWWLLFGGTHVIGSALPVRERLIGALGLKGFKGLYTVVSFATFIPLCWVYAHNRHVGEQLFVAGPTLGLVAQGIMLLAIVVLLQGLTAKNPISTEAEMSGHYVAEPTGILRITRQPVNTATALIGMAHCLANPFLSDWIFWGGFVVFAVISAMHQDARKRATGPEPVREFLGATSSVPFGAILSGRQPLRGGEFNLVALAIAVGLFALLRYYHGAWFGGFGG